MFSCSFSPNGDLPIYACGTLSLRQAHSGCTGNSELFSGTQNAGQAGGQTGWIKTHEFLALMISPVLILTSVQTLPSWFFPNAA
jgi:hypothetical protein